jgi:hypothetical protein
MIYYKLEGFFIIANAILVLSHKHSKISSKIPYKHHSNKHCKRTKIKIAFLNNLNEQYNCLADNFDENPVRNVKQVFNMQYAYYNPANMLNHQIRLTTVCLDVIRYIRQHLMQLFVFFTDYSLVLMKQAKEWFIDVTFDMWQGYVCFVINKSKIFNWYITGFIYLYETKKAYKHVEALNYLASALKLFKEEQTNHKLINNGKAAIINAWRTYFPNMP